MESSWTACRASSNARVRALRDEGRLSVVAERGADGDKSSRSGTISCVCMGEVGPDLSIEGGGGSDKLSVEDDAVVAGEKLAILDCENAATAAKLEDGDGRE